MGLFEFHDLGDDAAGHEAEIAGVGRDFYIGDFVDHLVARGGDEFFDPRFAGAGAALREDDVVALAPFREHLVNEFGRILEIDVHGDDGVAGGVFEAGEGGHRLAEAAGEAEEFDARITRAVLQNDVFRAVGRRVERENDFVVLRDGGENRTEAPEEFRDIFFLLINGDDDAEEHD